MSMSPAFTFTHTTIDPVTDDFIDTGYSVPTHYQVCDRCHGTGKHVNPSVDGNGLTNEAFDDPDFEESYFRGDMDVNCWECNGKRVTPEPNWDSVSPKTWDCWVDVMESQRECSESREAERRAGAG